MFFLSNDVDVVVMVKTNKQQEQGEESKKEKETQKKTVAEKIFFFFVVREDVDNLWVLDRFIASTILSWESKIKEKWKKWKIFHEEKGKE